VEIKGIEANGDTQSGPFFIFAHFDRMVEGMRDDGDSKRRQEEKRDEGMGARFQNPCRIPAYGAVGWVLLFSLG
jgi:hypothetical protein